MTAPPPPPLSSISTTRGSASPPPADLRHMQSNSVLVSPGAISPKDRSNRYSGIGLGGSKSPNSIPSSPTSVHSSSSAIFERDIEPLASPSPPATALHPPNPHRIPRAKATETLESSVPSVLDSAAEILANLSDSDGVSVEAPAINSAPARISSGWTSPVLVRSRSPSPGGGERKSLLLSIPQQQSPTKERQLTPPSIVTPTSAYFSTSSSTDGSPPVTTTRERVPSLPSASPTSAYTNLANANTGIASPTSTASGSPPSPTQVSTKRLSFMSYNDLLTSTPASTLPLSLLTSSVLAGDMPPHIPALANAALGGYASSTSPPSSSGGGPASSISAAGSTTASLRGFPIDPTSVSLNPIGKNRDSIVLLDEVGGEWEREGLGRGLEERLEGLLNVKG